MEKIKVGIYCRISTQNQSKNTSLQNQKERGIDFCVRNSYEYEVFSDIESGGKYERNEFSLLESKVISAEIKGIWVYDNDRLSRDVGVGQRISNLITSNNCKLFINYDEVKLELSDDRFGYNIRSVMSDYERQRIKERMDFGKKKLIRDGGKLGNVGLGYRRDKKRIVIDLEESKIVKDIFKLYLHKSVNSYGGCFRRLESKYKEKLNGKISCSSIGRILNDRKYLGSYNGTLEGEEYLIDIGRIISDDDFEKVSRKIVECKGLRKSNVVENYILKGKVKCNDCKENMWIKGGSDGVNDKKYKYYYCGNKTKIKRELNNSNSEIEKCISDERLNNIISRDKLENIVWEMLFEVLNNSEEVKNEYYGRWKNEKGSKDRFSSNLFFLESKVSKYRERIKIATQKHIDGIIDEDIYLEIKNEYENDILEINNEVEKINVEKIKSENIGSIEGYLELMKFDLNRDKNIDRFKDRKRIIDKYIQNIEVRYIGKSNNLKEYNITMNMFLKDKDLIGDKREVIIENDKNRYNFYILKFKTS